MMNLMVSRVFEIPPVCKQRCSRSTARPLISTDCNPDDVVVRTAISLHDPVSARANGARKISVVRVLFLVLDRARNYYLDSTFHASWGDAAPGRKMLFSRTNGGCATNQAVGAQWLRVFFRLAIAELLYDVVFVTIPGLDAGKIHVASVCTCGDDITSTHDNIPGGARRQK